LSRGENGGLAEQQHKMEIKRGRLAQHVLGG
jgi:hypothetical protein